MGRFEITFFAFEYGDLIHPMDRHGRTFVTNHVRLGHRANVAGPDRPR